MNAGLVTNPTYAAAMDVQQLDVGHGGGARWIGRLYTRDIRADRPEESWGGRAYRPPPAAMRPPGGEWASLPDDVPSPVLLTDEQKRSHVDAKFPDATRTRARTP